MNKREFNYKTTITKEGHFSPHITDKKLVKQLDAYCMVMNINKTKYVRDAIEFKLNFDLDNLKTTIALGKETNGRMD